MTNLIRRSARTLIACLVVISCAFTAPPAMAADVMLSMYSSDNTPASVLDARVRFDVTGSVLTVSVENRTDNNNPAATYNINEVYFNKSSAVTGLSVNMLPTPGWQLQTNSSNVGSFGSFDFKLEGGSGANTPDKVAPGETKVFKFNISGSGVDEDDFCMEVSGGSRPVIVACKFANGMGDVVENDDSAFGGGGVVDDDCMIPPSCTITPSGPLKITIGESVEFEVCGESMCDEGDGVTIEGVNSPDWCMEGNSFRSDDEECVSYVCTPPAPGMYELKFMATDDENDLTSMCSIMIEVNDEMCMDPPMCEITPPGPLKITLGESAQFEVCGQSVCEDTMLVVEPINGPDWCIEQTVPVNETCRSYSCTPPTAGMHTLEFRITDPVNQQSTTCSITIEVNEPPCMEPPTCEITPSGPLKITLGESVQFEVCGESSCDDGSVMVEPVNGPDWCIEQMLPVNESCRSFSCTPPTAGMHTLEFRVTDPENQQSSTCSIMVEVNEPCQEPPICTITPQGPIMAYVGEEFSFQVCGDSQCETGVEITPLNLPDWCSDADLRFDEHCVEVTCTPPNNVEGMYTFEFELKDTENQQTTRCSIDVEVVCHLEPMCFFTEDGPIRVAVGEEIDFEFCGASVCDGHKSRIEMKSRPPFIEPAGHLKGGPDETLCLPIKGTPGSRDIGLWRVVVTAMDLDTGIETQCDIRIIVTGPPTCEDSPVCEIDQEEEIEAAPGETVGIDLCAASACDEGTVMVELDIAPDFCGPFEPVFSEVGEEVCASIECEFPDDVSPGEYLFRFRVTDQENNKSTTCEVVVIIPEGPSGFACLEEEPNNDFSTCTLLDVADCVDLGCGSSVVGVLGTEGDDVDYYCLSGLAPLTDYIITVISGVDCDGAPVCAAIACLDANGEVIDSTNSGGPVEGYPSITCASDINGFIQIAVSGCDDLDIDGMADGDDRGGIGHGARGSYQMAVQPVLPGEELNMACHADMNGDGQVDAADLGMMIGVFGEVCAPE